MRLGRHRDGRWRAEVLPDGCMDLVWTGRSCWWPGPTPWPTTAAQARGHRGGPALPARCAAVPAGCARRAAAQPARRARRAGARARPRARWPGWRRAGIALALLAALATRLPGAPPDRCALRRPAPRALGPGRPPASTSPPGWARAPTTGRSPPLPTRSAAPRARCTAAAWRRSATGLPCCGGCCGSAAPPPCSGPGCRPPRSRPPPGYADQPHLSRETRALAGASPGQLASGANRSTPLPSGSSTTA